MQRMRLDAVLLLMVMLLARATLSVASVNVQCPGDIDGDAAWNSPGEPDLSDPNYHAGITKCMHISGGDGYITMADGKTLYIFGFSNLTGLPPADAIDAGILAANEPAPTITVNEGDEFYLTLTNVGMQMRPDLSDPHTVHWHGFPNAATIFDGVPDSSISINMLSSLTYYYIGPAPGTYMYHCHVEAAEHMQMGMLGNLYVRPAQNKLPNQTFPNGFPHVTGNLYTYNDGDGSTYYDVEYPIQIAGMDGRFHDASEGVQPLPFAYMKDNYPLLNGRGYPDTINPAPLPAPAANGGLVSQLVSSLITATQGQKILLRISNLNVTQFTTLATLGIPMQVIGKDAVLLRSSTGENLYYTTNSITLGGGETMDVLLDTSTVAPGTYPFYTTNLNLLSNDQEDFGGMMTEIVIAAP